MSIPLRVAIRGRLEIGCYTCSEREGCERLRRMYMAPHRVARIVMGKRVTVRDAGQEVVGVHCLDYQPEE